MVQDSNLWGCYTLLVSRQMHSSTMRTIRATNPTRYLMRAKSESVTRLSLWPSGVLTPVRRWSGQVLPDAYGGRQRGRTSTPFGGLLSRQVRYHYASLPFALHVRETTDTNPTSKHAACPVVV